MQSREADASQVDVRLLSDRGYPVLLDRQRPPIHLDELLAEEARRALHELRWVHEVRDCPLVRDDLGARHVPDQMSRRTRVVEVDAGGYQIVDARGLDSELPKALHHAPVRGC